MPGFIMKKTKKAASTIKPGFIIGRNKAVKETLEKDCHPD